MSDRDDWLRKFIVRRPHMIGNLAEQFEEAINGAQREEDLQKFLARNPFILKEQFPHGTHVVPKFRFGGSMSVIFWFLRLRPEVHFGFWSN